MRIIAGRYRRRKLWVNPGLVTRPITDRAKEILFERLGGELDGPRVADVFAGTGSLGLEALSRGGRSVVFIEQDRVAHELLRKNVAAIGVEAVTMCWQTDVLRTSFRPRGCEDFLPYDLVFFDPPYQMMSEMAPGKKLYRALERLAKPAVTADAARIVLRVPEGCEFECPPTWQPIRLWPITSMEMHVFEKQPTPGDAPVEPAEPEAD